MRSEYAQLRHNPAGDIDSKKIAPENMYYLITK